MPAKLSIADFQRFNPRRPLNWRFDRAQTLIREEKRASKGDDPITVRARRFLYLWNNMEPEQRIELFAFDPGLYYAHDIYNADDLQLKTTIETRLLAGQDDATIADGLNTLPEAIAAYEALFYNVRDRLKSRDWVQRTALYPAMQRGVDDMGFEFCAKLFAYFGGPAVADELLHMCDPNDRPSDTKDVSRYWERQLTRTLKRRSLQAAQFFEINKFNVIQLFSVVNDVRNLEHTIEQGDTNKTDLEQTAISLMSEIKFIAGLTVQSQAEGTVGAEFTGSAVELRSDEALRLTDGRVPEDLKELATLTLPPPRKRKVKEDEEQK